MSCMYEHKIMEIFTIIFHIFIVLVCIASSSTSSKTSQSSDSQPCRNNKECSNEGDLCIRGLCRSVHLYSGRIDTNSTGYDCYGYNNLPSACFNQKWPNVENCVLWRTWPELGIRTVESNSVPPYHVEPYCPFGLGEGYCNSPIEGPSDNCTLFSGITCPCIEGTEGCPTSTLVGDVLTPHYQYVEFPLHPDPTRSDLPKNMYNHTGHNGGPDEFKPSLGIHLNGIQINGPSEANGYNVDLSMIPLPCGGHVTPPLGPHGGGPLYHYHKAADCQTIQIPGDHGPLIGYAIDGFGIYGFGDYSGMPVLDECHGHFGSVPDTEEVTYHYHASGAQNMEGLPHKPYYLGCLGPSKGQCNSTVNDMFDFGANWCGPGCGFDVCVQPGTNPETFYDYLNQFPMGSFWLEGLSINEF